jgi:hypothetical protein
VFESRRVQALIRLCMKEVMTAWTEPRMGNVGKNFQDVTDVTRIDTHYVILNRYRGNYSDYVHFDVVIYFYTPVVK